MDTGGREERVQREHNIETKEEGRLGVEKAGGQGVRGVGGVVGLDAVGNVGARHFPAFMSAQEPRG